MTGSDRQRVLATAAGGLVILLWSSSFAVTRSLTERLGAVTAATGVFLLGGVLGCLSMILFAGGWAKLRRLSVCLQAARGAMFVVYEVAIFLALGLATNRQQMLAVSVINYLWPGLTLGFSILIFRYRARWGLPAGIAIALSGVVLATFQGEAFSWAGLLTSLRTNWLPYVLALVAAVSWALYSNLSRRWAQDGDNCAVPVFLLASGLAMAPLAVLFPESPDWTPRVAGEMLYMAVGPHMVAMVLWNVAVQRGNMIVVASMSHLAPVLSVIVSCLYLAVGASASLWLACGLVVGGAVICRFSVVPGQGTWAKAAPVGDC